MSKVVSYYTLRNQGATIIIIIIFFLGGGRRFDRLLFQIIRSFHFLKTCGKIIFLTYQNISSSYGLDQCFSARLFKTIN